ncbi:MAG: class I SAM-dependent methyltransferase [Bacteroidales bacterium]|nr:class I SAM-dependent methyltransferase [Bacteroidales bacterium]MCM1415468.1 class I SAM-dependent methyltransferase [bacterium]MCM1423405.1 class I SAM-dependent methyltransferase [bacterium]
MRSVTLSERLKTVVSMVTAGNRVCDVGCDHGFVSIYLVQQGVSPRVLAMDLREGPLRAAADHVAAYGLEGKIETRLSDGLHNYNIGEADTLVCAGMGGGLMQRILAGEHRKAVSFRELVLQPQSEIESFRRFLRESGYGITDEAMLCEDGKFYQVIRAVPGMQTEQEQTRQGCEMGMPDLSTEELCKLKDRYGPILLQKRTPVFISYLEREAAVFEEILENLRAQGIREEKRRERYEQIEALLQDNVRVRRMWDP